MKRHFPILPLLLLAASLSAQVVLKPFIGVDQLPDLADPICPIPLYLGEFEDSGLFEGDTVPDFQLFTADGAPFHLAEALAGKPVLLVNGNYTCPVFRGKVPVLNQIAALYGTEVTIRVVYTVEAHPDEDISPYFGYVNTGSPNQNAGILYRQPTTYGERLAVVNDMLSEMDIQSTVLVDGPCNEWWSVFGPAPNNAYLISPQGIVVAKHGWFQRSPEDMICDIERYFDPAANCGGSSGPFGAFSFAFTTDTIAYGAPGDAIYVEGLLRNTTDFPVNIEIKRMIEQIPSDWSSSMCIDICYNTSTDYTTIQVPAGSEQSFIMDFFTGSEGLGMVQIGFRNLDDPDNKYVRRMWASTLLISGSSTPEDTKLFFSVAPNPAKSSFEFKIPETWIDGSAIYWQLLGQNGAVIQEGLTRSEATEIGRNQIPAGLYFLHLQHARLGSKSIKVMID